mmetsp:Transcript_43316/g.97778  ORF Transcript_43316/g.97778 Transcript_43316/m.97778 type:complete len:576 (-) Transcript_43316:137-1864(-)
MNEYEYIYMKKRKDFGRYCNFDDVEPRILGTVDVLPQCGDMYVEQTILSVVLDNIPHVSESSVNTARVQTKSRTMMHMEGGWPKEIDCTEAQDTLKFRKRLEKDQRFIESVKQLTKQTTMCLEQNSTIDLFEHYFHGEEPEHLPENLTMKTIAIFKDPADDANRSVTKIGWHPEGPTKLVGSYSNLRFQRMTDEMPSSSFIWDISERNVPLTELRTTSPLICCQYNQKTADYLVAGCYNGVINHYDLRKGPMPLAKTAVEVTHYDPVYDVVWLNSKIGTECVSVSSDGRLLFWDVRKLSETVDECILLDGTEQKKTHGGVSLEWMQEAGPTKFLVGSEHGIILSCSKKPKKDVEIGSWFGQQEKGGYGRHFGPVYAVKRNPFHVKYFLTIGDWCAKIWMEELKGPMLQTPYYPSFLGAAAWSPTRAGVFFLCRHDGRMDIWDYYYRMNEVSLSQKVADCALTSLSVQAGGQLAAVGDSSGVITLLQLCDGLVHPGPNEKNLIGQLLDRETKREKNLDAIKKQSGRPQNKGESKGQITIDETKYHEREKAFFADVGMTGDDLGTSLGNVKMGGAKG